jgi:fructokinase
MGLPLIVGLGEILWDMFPSGPRFGGAPANFAMATAKQLAGVAQVQMVSAVGSDDLGKQATQELQVQNVDVAFVQIGSLPTGQVLVQLDDQGRASYRFAEQQAWDEIRWTSDLENLAQRCSVVCFGTLAQRKPLSRTTIQAFVKTAQHAIRLFDINIRQPHFSDEVALNGLRLANVVKLNEEELPVVAGLTGVDGEWREVARQIRRHWGLRYLAVTRGAEGALLLSADEEHFAPAPTVQVASTVGAGDAYAAALVAGILRGDSVHEINTRAVSIAADVCV